MCIAASASAVERNALEANILEKGVKKKVLSSRNRNGTAVEEGWQETGGERRAKVGAGRRPGVGGPQAGSVMDLYTSADRSNCVYHGCQSRLMLDKEVAAPSAVHRLVEM
jgi:hypothetical protein